MERLRYLIGTAENLNKKSNCPVLHVSYRPHTAWESLEVHTRHVCEDSEKRRSSELLYPCSAAQSAEYGQKLLEMEENCHRKVADLRQNQEAHINELRTECAMRVSRAEQEAAHR